MKASLSVMGSYSQSKDDVENDDIYIQEEPIPPQILAEILLRIDDAKTVGYTCPLVCRRWRDVLLAPGFWISYLQYRSAGLPPPPLRSVSELNIKKVALLRPFNKNLVSNPSGERSFSGWTISDNGGNRFKIERPPEGCANCLYEDISVAFATSYGWCRKHHVVDLWKEGIEPAFLDEFRPPITVSEYYNCRFDCASTYTLNVELVPDGQETCISTSRPVTVRRDVFGQALRFRRHQLNGDATTAFSITRIREMEQWTAAEWQKIEHTFNDYPRGIRYVVFEDAGKDNQFWAGHYGAKMAKASVIVNYGDGQRRCLRRHSSA